MASKNLPTNIDTTYGDDTADPSVRLHQQYHDSIHQVVNLFDYDAVIAATNGQFLWVNPSTNLIGPAPVNPASEQAQAQTLAIDTFSRLDAASLGTAESGQTWEILLGTWSVASFKATCAVGGTAVVDVGVTDMDVFAEITPTSGAPGLAFRSSAANTDRLTIQLDVTNGLFNLQKTDTSVTTSLASQTQSFTVGVTYFVRVSVVGNAVTCYLDGPGVTLTPLTYTLTTGEQTKYSAYTRAGLRNTGSATFDNFVTSVSYPGSGGSSPSYANLPAGTTLTVQESGGAYTRPTSRTDLYCIFVGTSNPGAVALEGDLWAQTP